MIVLEIADKSMEMSGILHSSLHVRKNRVLTTLNIENSSTASQDRESLLCMQEIYVHKTYIWYKTPMKNVKKQLLTYFS